MLIHYSVQRLKKVLLEDELGICADLERDMDELVGTYFDEWKVVANDPERQKQFRQFVNTVSCSATVMLSLLTVFPKGERVATVEPVVERGQLRPADWAKTNLAVHLRESDIPSPKETWQWRKLAKVEDLTPTDVGTT